MDFGKKYDSPEPLDNEDQFVGTHKDKLNLGAEHIYAKPDKELKHYLTQMKSLSPPPKKEPMDSIPAENSIYKT